MIWVVVFVIRKSKITIPVYKFIVRVRESWSKPLLLFLNSKLSNVIDCMLETLDSSLHDEKNKVISMYDMYLTLLKLKIRQIIIFFS